MPEATVFEFVDFSFDHSSELKFNYKIHFEDQDPLEFTETIVLEDEVLRKSQNNDLQAILEPLHLVLGLSYYKLYIPESIKHPYRLDKDQSEFWNTLYKKGLGEFLYRNNLDPKKIAKFSYEDSENKNKNLLNFENISDRILLGIGGGKDSAVSSNLLKNNDFTSFLVETQRDDLVSEDLIEKIGKPSVKIRRMLDPKIFEPHPGGYNGHIPISAVFAFLGFLSAALYDYKYFVVGNEFSSNFGNLEYMGETINHQWSKSQEFEEMFQEYSWNYITHDIKYFSVLRQFYEIRIAKLFSDCENLFDSFSSCNRNFKVHEKRSNTLWCGQCSKCAFTFLILSPFIEREKLIGIFGKNLLDDQSLLPIYTDLLGFGDIKPFDCVGTFEESQVALHLSGKSYEDSIIVQKLLPKVKNHKENLEKVMRTNQAKTLPTPFRFLGIENVGILGFGKEGKISEQFLNKFYPDLRIGVLDKSIAEDYLAKQIDYDLVIKTPGINREKVFVPYVTATNIFFSKIKNVTIGVTGTKGKSTTSALIYEILKTAGKKVRLIGNIGKPMLEVLLEEIDPDEIFVLELSSFMLDDIEYSPNIAVLLNLFPEHMDFHGSVEKYYEAKKNIFKFQKSSDHAVKGPVDDEPLPLKESEIPLLGLHNLQNVKAAIRAVRFLHISDDNISKALKNFRSLPHRLEFVGEVNGIKFYDDAISTTPQSAIAAIKSLPNVKTIFLGGTDRGYDFSDLNKVIHESGIKNIVLFPDSGKRILSSRDGFNILETKSMREAVDFAFEHTGKGESVALSTASPSFSLWKNFEVKGDEFKKEVLSHRS